MKKVLFAALISVCCMVTSFAQKPNPIEETAKKFAIRDNAFDYSVSYILAPDFRDEDSNLDKNGYIRRIRELKATVRRGTSASISSYDKTCVRRFYSDDPEKLQEIKEYSPARMAKEANKIRKTYRNYREDLKKETASVKVLSIGGTNENPVVKVSITDYENGEKLLDNVYTITLTLRGKSTWRVLKYSSEME
ncbi:MAG: hypothetical protein E7058_06450 [Lentisphaerae bacterium]|nr:hypothetical protein [Lentisphaerota bacterium]